MIRIRPSDLTNEIYRGQKIVQDDVLEIPDGFGSVIFARGLEARDVRVGRNSTICVLGNARIRRLVCDGDATFVGNAWVGSVRIFGDMIVDGDLSVWLDDILCTTGNICISGDLRVEGLITCRSGVVIAAGIIESSGNVKAMTSWSGASGHDFPRMAESAGQKAAERAEYVVRKTGKA